MQDDLIEYFKFRCAKGLKQRGLAGKDDYVARLKYEVEVIVQKGFCGYFLVIADILAWARRHDILTGPGRGSAAGSIVAYLLGITQVDPLQYNLVFERFLDLQRVSLPDIDSDVQDDRREDVLAYIRDHYGHDYVAQIGTFGTTKARAAIRDTGRALGYDYNLVDSIANLVLAPVEGKPQPLSTCFDKVPELRALRDQEGTPEALLLKWACKMENRIRSSGVHPAGVIVASQPIRSIAPLCASKEGHPVLQWDMNNAEQVGLVKFDFLGLNTLSTLRRCLDLIHLHHQVQIDLYTLPPDDTATFELLRSGEVDGCFQIETSGGIRDLLVALKPQTMEDLGLLVALYRPGPLESHMTEQVVKVRDGLERPQYLVPALEPILKPTAGVIVYQEQMLEICRKLAGFSYAEADVVRKACGKKIQSLMDAQEKKFKEGIQTQGYEATVGQKLWDLIVHFASYSFNKSHAISYAYITYYTAYLKAHYPAEYMCACLTSEVDNQEKIAKYIATCRRLGLKVLPPDVNHSMTGFSVRGHEIRFGLAAIKNVGIGAAKQIIKERKRRGSFEGLLEFAQRMKGTGLDNKRKVESLISCGAFDLIEPNLSRAAQLVALEQIWDYRKLHESYEAKQATYLKRFEAYTQREREIAQGSKKKSLQLPAQPVEPVLASFQNCPDFSDTEKLMMERQLIGFYVSGHPLEMLPKTTPLIDMVEQVNDGAVVHNLVGIIAAIKEITTKKNKERMAFMILEGQHTTIEAVVFPKCHQACRQDLVVGTLVVVAGRIEKNQVRKTATTDDQSEVGTKIILKELKAFEKKGLGGESILTIDQLHQMIQSKTKPTGKLVVYASGCTLEMEC